MPRHGPRVSDNPISLQINNMKHLWLFAMHACLLTSLLSFFFLFPPIYSYDDADGPFPASLAIAGISSGTYKGYYVLPDESEKVSVCPLPSFPFTHSAATACSFLPNFLSLTIPSLLSPMSRSTPSPAMCAPSSPRSC